MSAEERVITLLVRIAETLDEIKGLLEQNGKSDVEGEFSARLENVRASMPPLEGESGANQPQKGMKEITPSLDALRAFSDREFGGDKTDESLEALPRWPKRK